jgi:CubicO group peptidase (beta-lactamase class C family)
MLYELTGPHYRQKNTRAVFEKKCERDWFPMGEIRKCSLQHTKHGISKYKTVFNKVILELSLGLDDNDKLRQFSFAISDDEKAPANYTLSTSNPLATDLDKEVDAEVRNYMMEKQTVGLSVGILENGKTTFYGYGETERGNRQLPNEHTIFEIGSITKTFTAILLAYAANEGRLKLDDPVNKYLPDSIPPLEYEGTPITLKAMANHSSGIPRMPSNFHYSDYQDPVKDYNNNDLFSFYRHFKLKRRPGKKYEYSNLALGTVGVILSRIYGMNYESLVVNEICNPLGMNDTRQFIRKEDSLRFAKGYGSGGMFNFLFDCDAFAGAGGLRSTTADLLKYAAANMGKAPSALNQAILLTQRVTFKPRVLGINMSKPRISLKKIGLVWEIARPGPHETIEHGGLTPGFVSYLVIDPGKKVAVVILSNTRVLMPVAAHNIFKWIEKDVLK